MTATSRNRQVPLLPVVTNHPGANMSDAYRAFVRYALNHKLAPDTSIDLANIERGSVFFPPALATSLDALCTKLSLSFQVVVAGLAQAGADAIQIKDEDDPSDVAEGVPFKARVDQAIFYKSLITGLSHSHVVVAEASTGVGKGRALMAAAIDCAAAAKTPVIVAAPTVMTVNQLWSELQILRTKDHLGTAVSATILPGAAEFADDVALREWFLDADHQLKDPEVHRWVNSGAPHTANDAIGQVAREQGISLAWLMSDLTEMAVNMPIDDFVLRTDRSDTTTNSISRDLLANIRDAANRKVMTSGATELTHAGADIIICTHAMLALGQKSNWKVLPKPTVLIVDEAHLLEETISRMNSKSISLFAIRYKLARFCKSSKSKKGSVPRRALADATALMKLCQTFSTSNSREKLNDDMGKYQQVSEGFSALAKLTKSKAFSSEPSICNDMFELLNGAQALMKSKTTTTTLQFSPDKRYPLINVGSESIGQEAGALWKAASGGVVLASATMYITDSYGNQKCDYVVRNLSIPLTRLATPAPVVSKYLYTLPTLHLPENAQTQIALSRPDIKGRASTPSLEKDWISNVAHQVAQITLHAKGGSLVLFSSYDQISGLSAIIETDYPELSDRIVLQMRDAKFATFVASYKAIHSAGARPILVGLGPAWTGLNLSDDDVKPQSDTLLTDLIVGCCPIGLNQSPTMLRRVELTNTSAISKEALLTLKQGLGRLIRRNFVKERHIWVLDGRLWSETWLSSFTGPAKRLLSKYKNINYF